MNRKRVFNIVFKEWRIIFTDTGSTLIVFLLPFLIIAQMLFLSWLTVQFAGDKAIAIDIIRNALEKLETGNPALSDLPLLDQFKVLILSQFSFIFFLVPIMISMNTAAFSIVDEKLSGSLEALLATPVRTREILFGKAFSVAVPALIMTWICAGSFVLAITMMGWENLLVFVLKPVWFVHIILIAPLFALLSFLMAIIGSSRAKDAKNAQSIILLVVFPIFGLIALQVTGFIRFNIMETVVLALVLVAAILLVQYIAVKLFRRESIVIDWKS